MRIKSLHIQGFRNLAENTFCPCAGINIICGQNAQGKTNLLEAVWLFSGLRSFRGAKDADYISFTGTGAALDLEFWAEERMQTASIHWNNGQKKVSLNQIPQSKISAFSGIFCTVLFSPDHLLLVKDGPEKRRKMVDASLCQAYPKYSRILDHYEKVLKQRNRLLKEISQHAALLDTLDVWDTQLLEYAAYITAMRVRYVRRLGSLASDIYRGISQGKEYFSAVYRPSFPDSTNGMTKEDYKLCLQKQLRDTRAEDLRNGTTAAGPHRDDIEIQVDQKSVRSFGSQGQQRSAVLALKLAECTILEERCGEPPVVLLDDVMSELDDSRRTYLLNQLADRQILITGCNFDDFDTLRKGKIFSMKDGICTQG